MKLWGHTVVLSLVFWETYILFSIVVVLIYIVSPALHWGSFFSTFSPTFVVCIRDDSQFDRFEVIPYCDFDVHFSDKQCWTFFCIVGHLYIFLGIKKSLFMSSNHFLIRLFFCGCWVCMDCLFWVLTPYESSHWQIFSLFIGCLLILSMVSFLCKSFYI